jgi:ubiquinone/menaquinone biosynthesis C-methylase UbiE
MNKKFPDNIYGLYGYEKGKIFSKWIGKEKKILDLGCGSGILAQFYSKNNKITGVDISVERGELFKKRTGGGFTVLDLNTGKLEFPDKTFDVVVASELLYYLNKREEIVKEINRVLKDDGIFIGAVINIFSLVNKIRFFLEQPEKIDITQKEGVYYFSYKRLLKLLLKEFSNIKIISFSKIKILKDIFPSLFSSTLGFYCKK